MFVITIDQRSLMYACVKCSCSHALFLPEIMFSSEKKGMFTCVGIFLCSHGNTCLLNKSKEWKLDWKCEVNNC